MKNITPQQEKLLSSLKSLDPRLIVHWDEARGVASSIRGSLIKKEEIKTNPEESFEMFLKEFGALFGPTDLSIEMFKVLRQKKDNIGHIHLFFQHMVQKEEQGEKRIIEVYGSKLAAHFNAKSILIEVQSSLWRDIRIDAEVGVKSEDLLKIQLKRIESVKGFAELRKRLEKEEQNFPLTDPPRLVVYPWKGVFPLAWITYGYGVIEDDLEGKPTGFPKITYGQLLINATTGEQILFAPTINFSETPDTGSGFAVTPISGPPYTNRTLNIVRVGSTTTYRLKDDTLNRDIVTYDVACSTSYDNDYEIGPAITGGTLPVSEDTDGDKTWDRLPTDPGETRTSGQQPEVDCHYFARRQYEWYNVLAGGRDGWDDGNYTDPPVPPQDISVLAHCRYPGDVCTINNAYCWYRKSGGVWVFWLAFMEGDNTNYDYLAGSHFIFAHEYQHAITNFSFEDGIGDPCLTYDGWLGAVHEGLSDTFGGLSSEQWLNGRDISLATSPQVFRNLVYPRDTAAYSANRLDHFDDRNTTTSYYSRGTILAHTAYLMGKGGVHQRVARNPELIPVYSLGRETIGSMSFLKAARIWYRALTIYFSTHGNLTGEPTNDQNTFRTLRNGCVNAAEDLFGLGSAEHRNTILAFYATGLHPSGENYGGDVTFLRWGIAWDLSRTYVGLPCPDYRSLDLFINNGGISEWNALINIVDPSTGQPTDYENIVYCRVRNVGDQAAQNVQVDFEYIKAGTGTGTWTPVTDKHGTVQTLTIGTLSAGQSNFPDSDQDSPPTSASVKWHIPPLAAGEEVHHFCLKAKVTSSNDVNTHNNTVQTNISYSEYSQPAPVTSAFLVGNPDKKKRIPLELKIDTATLPKNWRADIKEKIEGLQLEPNEERILTLVLETTAGADDRLEPPLDGDLKGRLYGEIAGPFTGSLTGIIMKEQMIQSQFTGRLPYLGTVVGKFNGTIDLDTAQVKGKVIGTHPCGKVGVQICAGVDACLRPWRHINISQWHDKELIGGVTFQIQVPWEKGPCALKLPPIDTKISLRRKKFRDPKTDLISKKEILERE